MRGKVVSKAERLVPLTISGIPEDLKADIRIIAKYNRRSLSAEIIELLSEIVAMKKSMKTGVFA